MARRKEPHINDAILDQLLSGTEASAAFDQCGVLDQLKKALAERALNAEMDHHPAGEAGAGKAATAMTASSNRPAIHGISVSAATRPLVVRPAARPAFRGPAPWHEFVDAAVGPAADEAGQQLGEVALRIDAVQPDKIRHFSKEGAAERGRHSKQLRWPANRKFRCVGFCCCEENVHDVAHTSRARTDSAQWAQRSA